MQRFLEFIRGKSRQKGLGFFYIHENEIFRQNFDSLRARASFECR
jgi:hypothetical protein